MAVDLLLAVILSFAPNGGLVAAVMAPEPPSSIVVPRTWIHDTLVPLHVVLFDVPGAGPLERERSLYLASEPSSEPASIATELAMLGAWLGPLERALPELPAPRLLLRRDVLAWRVGTMPTDVAEAFFDAVLAARIDRLRRDRGVESFVDRRAAELFASEVTDAATRREIYVEAVTSFGASLLAVGVQIERIHARRGRALCPLIRDGRLLFGHWRRTFESAVFRGMVPSTEPGGEPHWSAAVLAPEDKLWLVREVVGARWTGDPAVDFVTLCG